MAGLLGIHHVTAIASDPQRNLDFYAGVLGMRLVKRTVNFDDPQTYHFYFGDEAGSPGSILTFFPWPGARAGRPGPGQVAVTSFAIPPAALGFWIERLLRHQVRYQGPTRRGAGPDAEQVIAFRDPDGLMLELVAHARAAARPAWADAAGIPHEHAIHGLHGVTLWVAAGAATERVLTDTLGFRPISDAGSTRRFAVGDDDPRGFVDVRTIGDFARALRGAGTVHHVAFAVDDDASELAVRERVIDAGLHATPVIDRNYFRSVYFREPGGVLYELATTRPGFTLDEPLDRLGSTLKLPPHLEAQRIELEAVLPPIRLPAAAGEPTFPNLTGTGAADPDAD